MYLLCFQCYLNQTQKLELDMEIDNSPNLDELITTATMVGVGLYMLRYQ